jgi:LSD1 subclass zinc finger protein
MFGAGLLENVSDSSLEEYFAASAAARKALGIKGRFNRSGNDGTITRFGWKAQNKSLLIFSGEAYNVEQGVTSELFASERATAPGCNLNPTPEDTTNLRAHGGGSTGTAAEMSGDPIGFAAFARLLAPPMPTTASPSELRGARLFTSVGCALCHTTTMVTDPSAYTGQGGLTFHPYSDLAVHHMGRGLADHVSQGAAGPDEFRTAPLWGLGQRLFFLHDGRTRNLLYAIRAHHSAATTRFPASEANQVVERFFALTEAQKQDVLNFLRSL